MSGGLPNTKVPRGTNKQGTLLCARVCLTTRHQPGERRDMPMQLKMLFLAVMPLLSAQAAKPASPLIAQAKQTIAAEMIDPSSVQYRNVRTVRQIVGGKPVTIVCGEVNSKNRMGGYVGFAKFAYEPTILHGAVSLSTEGKVEFYGGSNGKGDEAEVRLKGEIMVPCMNG